MITVNKEEIIQAPKNRLVTKQMQKEHLSSLATKRKEKKEEGRKEKKEE